jgi:3-methyladenine DNA glycosylase Tag
MPTTATLKENQNALLLDKENVIKQKGKIKATICKFLKVLKEGKYNFNKRKNRTKSQD